MVKTMKTDQSVMLITVRRDTAQGLHLLRTLRSVLSHPQYRGAATWTDETFPQTARLDDGETDAA